MGHLPHRGRPSPGRAVPSYAPRGVCLGEVVAQVAAARRVAELAQRLGLDLADPLPGGLEVLAPPPMHPPVCLAPPPPPGVSSDLGPWAGRRTRRPLAAARRHLRSSPGSTL